MEQAYILIKETEDDTTVLTIAYLSHQMAQDKADQEEKRSLTEDDYKIKVRVQPIIIHP